MVAAFAETLLGTRIAACLAVVALVFPAARAEPAPSENSTWKLDAAASRVSFVLDATLHKVEGTFELVSGEIRFDPETGSVDGRVVVDARSGNTGNAKRDRKMHQSVLRSAEHPFFEFVPASFEGRLSTAGNSDLELQGKLFVQGVGHVVTLPVELQIGPDGARARGSFEVPYVEWGLEDPSAFVLRVGKIVEVDFEAMGSLAADSEK